MNEIDLTPEYKALHAELQQQKELYLTLLLKRNDLIEVQKPDLEAVYAVKLGYKKLELLQKEAEVAGLKYKMELMIACINRKEKIDLREIDQTVEQMLKEYFDKINRQAEEIEEAQEHLSHLMSPANSAELKKIYYDAAKLLHPDINPNLTQAQQQLWNVISDAYKTRDLETLRNLYAAIHDEKYIPEELIYEYESLKNQIIYFKGQVSLLLEWITVIQMDFPFTIREKLYDDEWLKSEHLTIDKRLVELNALAAKYTDYIDLITGN
jgi:hypothetical protein